MVSELKIFPKIKKKFFKPRNTPHAVLLQFTFLMHVFLIALAANAK